MSEKERAMSDYTPTPEAVEAFKAAWHEADAEGDVGNRVLRGLTAVGPVIAAEVRGQREAFLPSDTLDPAWIAGWHAAIDHVAAHIESATGGA